MAAIEKLPDDEQRRLREWFGKRDQPQAPVLQKLRALAGTAKNLPADLAANHDHYLHGMAKRSMVRGGIIFRARKQFRWI